MNKPRKSKVWQPKELREQIMLMYATYVWEGLRINSKGCPIEGQCEELDSLLKKKLLVRTDKDIRMGGRTSYTIVHAVDTKGVPLPVWGDYNQRPRCPCCGNQIWLCSVKGHALDCPVRF